MCKHIPSDCISCLCVTHVPSLMTTCSKITNALKLNKIWKFQFQTRVCVARSHFTALYRSTKENMHHNADEPRDKCECETIIAGYYHYIILIHLFIHTDPMLLSLSVDKLVLCLVRTLLLLLTAARSENWLINSISWNENKAASTKRDDNKSAFVEGHIHREQFGHFELLIN